MNLFLTYGKISRIFGLPIVTRMFQPYANIRVTYTHDVSKNYTKNFNDIVKYLKNDRLIISPEEFLNLMDSKSCINHRHLLMTFDDGFLSNYYTAMEILDRYEIKAIFFIPTAILDLKTKEEKTKFANENIYFNALNKGNFMDGEFEFMSAGHLIELKKNGHMICPHTHSHVILKEIKDDITAQTEIVNPKEILENLIHDKIRIFSFPVGTERQIGNIAMRYIRQHYDYCFTATPGINIAKTNKYLLHRDHLPSDASLGYINTISGGAYDLYYKLRLALFNSRNNQNNLF